MLAEIPENKAMENDAPAVSERFPILIRGRASVAILLVQLRDSMKLATSRPTEIKKIRRIRGQIRLGQSWGRMSANCMFFLALRAQDVKA